MSDVVKGCANTPLGQGSQRVDFSGLRLHRHSSRERDQDGSAAATSGFMRRSSGERGVDAHPTAGWQGLQREGLRLTRVRGVPFAGTAVGYGTGT
jgi:hypothetical protein